VSFGGHRLATFETTTSSLPSHFNKVMVVVVLTHHLVFGL